MFNSPTSILYICSEQEGVMLQAVFQKKKKKNGPSGKVLPSLP
jgi:hypothetical protein